MFCSEKCCAAATNEVHHLECNNKSDPLDFHPCMRLLLKYLNIFDGDVLQLQKFLRENSKPVTIFDFDFSDPDDPMRAKNLMLVELSMRNTSKQLEKLFPIHRARNAVYISRHPKLKELWRQHGHFLEGLLRRLFLPSHVSRCLEVYAAKPINLPAKSFADKYCMDFNGLHSDIAGIGMFPASSLLNSSCDSNIDLMTVSNKLAWVVRKPIPAGAQLTGEYNAQFYASGPAANRRQELEALFGFICDCDACEHDWPTLKRLEAVDPEFTRQSTDLKATQRQAKENVEKYFGYIEKNHQHSKPTKEVYDCILSLPRLFIALTKPTFYP